MSIGQKIGLGFACVILLFLVSFAYTIYISDVSKNKVVDILNRDLPTNNSLYEMEIGLRELELYIRTYLQRPESGPLREARRNHEELVESLNKFSQSSHLERTNELTSTLRRQIKQLWSVGETLIRHRQRLSERRNGARTTLIRLQNHLDRLLRWDPHNPSLPATLSVQHILKLDRIVARHASLLDRLTLKPTEEEDNEFERQIRNLKRFWSQVHKPVSNEATPKQVKRVDTLLQQYESDLQAILRLQQKIHVQNQNFHFMGNVVDYMLDNRIQNKMAHHLDRRSSELISGLNENAYVSFMLLFLSLLGGTGTAILVTRRFRSSITKLMGFAEKIGRGNFGAKTDVKTGDEIEALADSLDRMANQLQETTISRDYLEDILESIKEYLVVLTPEGDIVSINQAFTERLGLDPDELRGRPLRQILDEPIVPNGEGSGHSQRDGNGLEMGVERTLIAPDGSRIPVLLSVSALEDHDDRTEAGYVCVGTDISEQKAMRRQLEESLREKDTLLQEVHHRVKNNLQVVISLLNLQARKSSNEETKHDLSQARGRIHSMAVIHEQLYQAERLHSVSLPKYVEELTDKIVSSYGPDDRSIDLELDVEDTSLEVSTLIPCGLIINELMSNAFEHAFTDRSDGRVGVRFRVLEGGWKELVVYDNGTGYDARGIDELDSLGMRLVKQLAENQLKGKIEVSKDDGTRFTIRFPPQNN